MYERVVVPLIRRENIAECSENKLYGIVEDNLFAKSLFYKDAFGKEHYFELTIPSTMSGYSSFKKQQNEYAHIWVKDLSSFWKDEAIG